MLLARPTQPHPQPSPTSQQSNSSRNIQPHPNPPSSPAPLLQAIPAFQTRKRQPQQQQQQHQQQQQQQQQQPPPPTLPTSPSFPSTSTKDFTDRTIEYLQCLVVVVILGAFCASNSFSSLLRFVFSFALGGCVSVFGAVVLLLRYLKKEQLKAARRKDDSLQIAQTSRLMQERKKNAESDMQSWAKLFPANPHSTSSELKNKEPSFLVLKSNLLFEFRDEKDPECLGVMCLDNALLSVNMTKKNLSRGDKWQKKNSIKVQKLPEQKSLSLNGGLELVYIYFSSARQLQVWFLALRRASKLCWKTNDEIEAERKEKLHFSNLKDNLVEMILTEHDALHPGMRESFLSASMPVLSEKLSGAPSIPNPPPIPFVPSPSSSSSSSSSTSSSSTAPRTPRLPASQYTIARHPPVSATWFNAILSRVFWNFHNTPMLTALFRRKLATKIAAINPPSIVEKIEIGELVLGPNLPLLDNVQLSSLDQTGEVRVDADVRYYGGAHVTIKILITVNFVSFSVPLTISATLKSLSGRLQMYIAPPPSDVFWLGFHSEPTVELEVHTEIGRGGKIVDFPALANIVIDKLKRKLIKTMVLPAMDDYQFFKEDGGDPSASSSTSPSGLDTSPSSPSPSPITSENNSPTSHSSSTPSELEGKGVGYQTGSSNSFTSLPTPEGIYEHLVTSSTSSPNLDGGRRARSRSLTLDQSTALSAASRATSLEGTQEEMTGGSEGGREARSFSSIPNPKPLPAQDPSSPVHHSYRGEKYSSPASLGTSSPPFSSSPPGEEKSLLTSLWRNFTKKD